MLYRFFSESFLFVRMLDNTFPSSVSWAELDLEQCETLRKAAAARGLGESNSREIFGIAEKLQEVGKKLLGEDPPLLLLLKIGLDGAVERAYPPAVFAAVDKRTPVLKWGNRLLPIEHQADDYYTCNGVRMRAKVETVLGRNEVTLRLKDGDNLFDFRGITNPDCPKTDDDYDRGNAALQDFLYPVNVGGGSQYVALKHLELGEHSIAKIEESESKFSNFELILANGDRVSPNAALKREIGPLIELSGMEAANRFYQGSVLQVLEKREKEGKVFVTCRIKLSPKMLGIEEADPQQVLTGVPNATPAAQQSSLDDLPF